MQEVEAYPRAEDELVYRQAWELPHKIRNAVPYYLRDLVCTCENTGTYVDRWINRYLDSSVPITKCKKCHKYVRWIQRICMKCDVRFVLTFSHPRYVIQWPTCWDCTQDESYDPWYEQAKKFPGSAVAINYQIGIYDSWPNTDYVIEPPKPEDLIHKEQVTELEITDINLGEMDTIF